MSLPFYQHFSDLSALVNAGYHRIALAIGVFDGVHLGHQVILKTLSETAKMRDALPVVMTFYPHPRQLLTALEPQQICTHQQRLKLLTVYGAQATVTLPFTKDLSNLSPTQFVTHCLSVENLTITDVIVGNRWRFGHCAAGDVQLLKFLSQQYRFNLIAIPEQKKDDLLVSSSTIRRLLANHQIEHANQLLAHPFCILGKVDHGFGVASQELDTPTANLVPETSVFLPPGVYSTIALIDQKLYPSITAIGISPTFQHVLSESRIEVHLYDQKINLYGKKICLFFSRFIREECHFTSTSLLKNQIFQDIQNARKINEFEFPLLKNFLKRYPLLMEF